MRVVTFCAPDLATALGKARSELGPNALVLSQRERKGLLGLSSIEITVAVDRTATTTRDSDTVLQKLANDVRGQFNRRIPTSNAAQLDGDDATLQASIDGSVRQLVAEGLSEDLSRRFARITHQRLTKRASGERWIRAASQAMSSLVSFAPLPKPRRALFVVGPSGAGKSATVAKLAARSAAKNKRVVLAQADQQRAGALAESDIYSRCLGIDLVEIRDPDDLRRTVREVGRSGCVVVDTPGVGQADRDRLSELQALRGAVKQADVAVIVPAGLNRGQADRILDRFTDLQPTCVALSKVDDGNRIGEVISAIADSELPLSFVTTGQRVPDDLEPATPEQLTRLLIPSMPTRASIQSPEGILV